MATDLTPAIVEAKLRLKEFAIIAKNGISEVWLSMGVVTKDGEDLPYVTCKRCFKTFRFLSHKTGTSFAIYSFVDHSLAQAFSSMENYSHGYCLVQSEL